MEKLSVERDLAVNLGWLMDSAIPRLTAGALAKKAKLDQKTVWRMQYAENSAQISSVAAIAAVFHVAPWQMVAHRLGASLHRVSGDRIVAVAGKCPTEDDVRSYLQKIDDAQAKRSYGESSGKPQQSRAA